MSESVSSSELIQQRVRQRIVEWLEMVAEYPSDPPPWDLNETVNQWYDWSPDHPTKDSYPAPIYSEREAQALLSVGTAVEVFCQAMPATMRDDSQEMARPEWIELVGSIRQALQAFARREAL